MSLTYNPQVFKFSQLDLKYIEELEKEYGSGNHPRNKTYQQAQVLNTRIKRNNLERSIPWGSLDQPVLKVATRGAGIRHISTKKLTNNVWKEGVEDLSPMFESYYKRLKLRTNQPTCFKTDPRYIHPAMIYQQVIFGTQTACPAVMLAVGKMRSSPDESFSKFAFDQGVIDEMDALFESVTSGTFRYTSSRPSLRRLFKKLNCMKGKDFRDLESLLAGLSYDVYSNGGISANVITLLAVLESCFAKAEVSYSTPGFVIVAPPGTGKTKLASQFGFGFIDTDCISSSKLDADPTIMNRMLNCGFSFVTNRWEHKIWNHPYTFYVTPKDIEASLEYKGIHKSTARQAFVDNLKQARKDFYRRKVGPRNRSDASGTRYRISRDKVHVDGTTHNFDQEKWVAAYSDLPVSRTYVLGKGQTLVDGYLAILQDIISHAIP